MKKYIIPITIGTVIGIFISGILSSVMDYLLSIEISLKTMMLNSPYFKLILGGLFGGVVGWIITHNKR